MELLTSIFADLFPDISLCFFWSYNISYIEPNSMHLK